MKDMAYALALTVARAYWRIFKPRTFGARLLLVHGNKILLVRPRGTDYWNFPGGGIRRGENPAEGAVRELKEETGIRNPGIEYCLGSYTSTKEGKRDTVYIYVASASSVEIPRLEIELQDAKWFEAGGLPEKTTRPTRLRIDEYAKGLKNLSGIPPDFSGREYSRRCTAPRQGQERSGSGHFQLLWRAKPWPVSLHGKPCHG